jgi:shikimate dehydrogenase
MSIRAAVIGNPVAHSLSPTLHNAAYKHLGLDWKYEAINVPEQELEAFLVSAADSFAGLSVTMPLKTLAYELSIQHDEFASSARAVNTLIPSAEGWIGSNTDVPGATNALRQHGLQNGIDATLIGSGATARSILLSLKSFSPATVKIAARNAQAVSELQSQFESFQIEFVPLDEFTSFNGSMNHLLVNTLPDSVALNIDLAGPLGFLFDVNYAPWPTQLVSQVDRWKVIGGLDFLTHQAILQVSKMTGLEVDSDSLLFDAMYAAGRAEQLNRS